MGKPTGFMEYDRVTGRVIAPKERILNFREFHLPLSKEEQQKQGARCMECGVPFCQSGMMIEGMASGCPLHNLIPEWNDLVYTGVPPFEKDEQFPGIYLPCVPGAVRGSMYLRQLRRGGNGKGKRVWDYRIRLCRRHCRGASAKSTHRQAYCSDRLWPRRPCGSRPAQ